MSLYYRTLIQSGLLLDIYPNAAVAYSLRKLREGYKKVFNLLTYSEDISQTTYQKVNLVTTGTPPYIDVVTAPNGTLTADKLIEDTSFNSHFITQTLGITVVGLDYNFSVYLKAGERTKTDIQAGGVGQARINLLTGAIETSTFPISPIVTDAGNGWWRFSVTFNANSTLINPLYRIFTVNNLNQGSYVGDGVSGLYVWGFQLTQSSSVLPYEKTIVGPSNGSAIRVRRTSDSIEQDFGFDSSGNLDVNSIEAFVGYNLFAWSEQLQFTYWVKTNLQVTTDTLVAPDGLTTGDILFETVTSGTHVMGRTLAVRAGREYTVSFWVQPQGRTFIRVNTAVNLSWDGTTIPSAWINLSTGTIISQSAGYGGTFQITTAPNGWFLINYTVRAVNNATSQTIELNLSTNGSQIAYVGDPTLGVAVWGLQVTESSTIRPYRQTLSIGEGDGRIVTFYDQSGNGNNSTQASPNIQHLICQNGFITRNTNSKPVILLSAVAANFYTPISTIPTTSPHFSTSIYNYTGGNFASFGNRSVGGSPTVIYQSTTNLVYRFTNTGVDNLSVPYTTSGNQIITASRVVNDMQLYGNNSLIGNRNTAFVGATIPITNITQHVSGSQIVRGELFEMIFWNQNYTSLRSDITNKINEYYAIY
jgi:hypothetical protein